MVITAENSWQSNQLTTDTPMTVESQEHHGIEPMDLHSNPTQPTGTNSNFVYKFSETNNCGQMIPKLSQDDPMIVAPSQANENFFNQVFNDYYNPTPILPSELGVLPSSLSNNQENFNGLFNHSQPNTNGTQSFLRPRLKSPHLLFSKKDIFDFDDDVTFIDTTSHKTHENKKLKLREKKYERKLRKNIKISKIKNQ
jgi:hypothetical protein